MPINIINNFNGGCQMNLQFSVSATPSRGLTGTGYPISNASSGADSQVIQAANSTVKLSKLEHQDVPVSIGDEQLRKTIDRAIKAWPAGSRIKFMNRSKQWFS